MREGSTDVVPTMCDECEHLSTFHDEWGNGCSDCDCLLSAREAAEGRDEAMDDSIGQALWEEAVVNGEPWALGDRRG